MYVVSVLRCRAYDYNHTENCIIRMPNTLNNVIRCIKCGVRIYECGAFSRDFVVCARVTSVISINESCVSENNVFLFPCNLCNRTTVY